MAAIRNKRNEILPVSRLIQLSAAHSRCMWVPFEQKTGILIDSVRGIFQDIGDVREQVCQQGAALRNVAWLDNRFSSKNFLIERPLRELKWCAAYFEYNNELPDYLKRDDIIGIRDYPNFNEVPHLPEFRKIADLLHKRPTSPAFAARLLKIDENTMHHFYFTLWHANGINNVNRRDFHNLVSDRYHNPVHGIAASLKDILTTDIRDLLEIPAIVGVKQLLFTDVTDLWELAAQSRLNQSVNKALHTDVMDILTADLFAPFKKSNQQLARPASDESLQQSITHMRFQPITRSTPAQIPSPFELAAQSRQLGQQPTRHENDEVTIQTS